MKLIISAFALMIVINVALWLHYKNSSKAQPFIILDTKEIIKTGDTLYVVYASEDSLFLYGK